MRFVLIIIILLLTTCDARKSMMMDSESAPAAKVSQAQTENKSDNIQENYIIKTANYKFQVENVEQSTKNIEKLVSTHQSFIADMNLISTGSEITNTLVIRTPSKSFERLMEDLGKEALFTNFKKISAEDVAEEFIDIKSRLKTKKEVMTRYVDILKNKAKTVEEVIKAEEQIRILQEEIEAKEGRLKYLQSRVSMSTINLEIYQRVDYKATPDTFEKPYIVKLKQSLSNGWNIVTTASLVLSNIWPLVVVLIVLIYLRRNWIRKKLA